MLKVDVLPPKTRAQLVNDHFSALNRIVQSGPRKGQYYTGAVHHKLTVAINNHNGVEKDFFKFLMGPNDGDRLRILLGGEPAVLQGEIDDFEANFPGLSLRERNANGRWVSNVLGETVLNIFNYQNYRSSPECLNILSHFGVRDLTIPCPYCNCDEMKVIQYDHPLTDEEQRQALLDLDHFFPKSKYPFLAVSLFNLVPSCNNCNRNIKSDKDFKLDTHVQPFERAFDDEFEFYLEEPYIPGTACEDLLINYRSKNGFPDATIIDLRLTSRYNAERQKLVNNLQLLHSKLFETLEQLPFTPAEIAEIKKTTFASSEIPLNRSEINKYAIGKLKLDILIDQGYL